MDTVGIWREYPLCFGFWKGKGEGGEGENAVCRPKTA